MSGGGSDKYSRLLDSKVGGKSQGGEGEVELQPLQWWRSETAVPTTRSDLRTKELKTVSRLVDLSLDKEELARRGEREILRNRFKPWRQVSWISQFLPSIELFRPSIPEELRFDSELPWGMRGDGNDNRAGANNREESSHYGSSGSYSSLGALGKIVRLFGIECGLILPASVLSIVMSCLSLVNPTLIGWFYDAILESIVSGKESDKLLTVFTYILCFYCVSVVIRLLIQIMFSVAGIRLSRRLFLKLFEAVLLQDQGFFDVRKTGELMSRLVSDSQTVTSLIINSSQVFMNSSIATVGGCLCMFRISWQLSVVALSMTPLIVTSSYFYGEWVKRVSTMIQDANAKANEVAVEILSQIRTVQSFGCERREILRYLNRVDYNIGLRLKLSYIEDAYRLIVNIFNSVLSVTQLWYGAYLVINHYMTMGDMIAFGYYVQMTTGGIKSLTGWYTSFMSTVGKSRRFFEILEREPVPDQRKGGLRPPKLTGKIEFDEVCFSYPTRPSTRILNRLTFTVNPGECVALIGPTGGGKSTVLKLLMRFYQSTQGAIRIDGVDVENIDVNWVRENVGMVSQEPVLFSRSIAENIAYGAPTAPRNALETAARLANAHGFISRFPEGYDTHLGESGTKLSGGQKQRLAIARAIARNAPVLLLDEATSALDSENEQLVQDALTQLMKGRTTVVIAHRLSTIMRADRILVIIGGRIVESGTHEELLALNKNYANFVKRQIGTKLNDSEKATREKIQKQITDLNAKDAAVPLRRPGPENRPGPSGQAPPQPAGQNLPASSQHDLTADHKPKTSPDQNTEANADQEAESNVESGAGLPKDSE